MLVLVLVAVGARLTRVGARLACVGTCVRARGC